MAKKTKRARVPKRILGVKISKPFRRAARPLAEFLDTDLGRSVVTDAIVAIAVAFASTKAMRKALKRAGKHARRSGAHTGDLVLHLGRAAILPALVALHAKLPGEVRAGQKGRDEQERTRRGEPVH